MYGRARTLLEAMGSVERAGDAVLEGESGEEEVVADGELAQQLLKRGGMLSAIQGRINAEALASLPPVVKRRVRALKNLQLQVTNLEAKFYEEVHELEIKYMKLYAPFFDKRAEIVNGVYEPTEDECKWEESDDEDEQQQLNESLKSAKITEVPAGGDKDSKEVTEKKDETESDKNITGIPDFWLTIFRNVSMLSEMMQEYDEPIIRHLEDIKVILLHENPMGFVLEFYFSSNKYFSNKVLTKEYHMRCKPEEENPLEFEGPEIFNCKGCVINWCKGKNVTVKTIKKKQKHKSRGSVRTVTKNVQADSFFNFFTPPEMGEDTNTTGLAEDIQALMTTDFEIGHYIRERVVPRAVLLFTGEGLDDDDDEYDEEEEEEEESSEESDEEEEDEEEGGGGGGRGESGRRRPTANTQVSRPRNAGGGALQAGNPANPAECKQQ